MTILTATPMPDARRAPKGNLLAAAEELLITATEIDTHARSVRRRAISGALNVGMTWDEIGALLGSTGDAARLAYKRAGER